MKPSQNCIDLIKQFEGLSLKAYLCPAGIPTIGYGSTRWPDGKKIDLGQQVTMDVADQMLRHEADKIADRIPANMFNQNQFDAIVSFTYNVGIGNLLSSTLYTYAKANVNDVKIRDQFMRWTKARVGGKMMELRGLVRRRQAEADLYFK